MVFTDGIPFMQLDWNIETNMKKLTNKIRK